MAYKIVCYKYGVVTRFAVMVSFGDVLRSEQQIHEHPDFTWMRYVIADFSDAQYSGLTNSQKADINVLPIGGRYSSPPNKYAFALKNPVIREQIGSAVANGEMLHLAQTFDTFEQASDWAVL
jgi:hypothetical protein